MTTRPETKINKLLQEMPSGSVLFKRFLQRQKGFSKDLLEYYVKSGWLEALGPGVYKRKGDQIDWLNALQALQGQSQKQIHAGGITALGRLGWAHYIRFHEEFQLFAPRGTRLPGWFSEYSWQAGKPALYNPSCLQISDAGYCDHKFGRASVRISSPERAILEMIYLCPKHADMLEAYQIMEGMTGLRPGILNELLASCTSIKVKRLFLYMADKAGHQWFRRLNFDAIALGSGSRSLSPGGVFDAKYKITVPRELAAA